MTQITAQAVVDAITRGTDIWQHRNDPKRIVVRHCEDLFSLVEWRGSSYSCRGSNYVPGHVDIVRHSVDLATAGGLEFWSTARDEHGVFTPKRLEAWLTAFRDGGYLDRFDMAERYSQTNRAILVDVTRQAILSTGGLICAGAGVSGRGCTHVVKKPGELCRNCTKWAAAKKNQNS